MKGEHYTMKNLSSFAAAIKSKVFKMSGDKINQTERNATKSAALEAITTDLFAAGLTAVRTSDGIVIEIENDDLGSIFFELDIKVKGSDFDITSAVAEYQDKVAAAAERITAAAKRKEQRIAEKAAKVSKK
jgi:hypothetical protein